jgi:ABC-type transport system involved in multi-copper enzyme maturation permease subunit
MSIRARLMPTLAILQHDLGTLASNWLVRLWLLLSGLLVFVVVSSNWPRVEDGPLIAMTLIPYLFMPWFLVVIMLGVGPVAGARAESLSDGILSRPVTRYEYLLASWAARVITVLGVFLVVVVPAILLIMLADRPESTDPVTSYGVLASLFVVSLVLTLQVSLAFLLGTLLRRQMVAVALLAMGWLVSAAVLGTFQLEEFSPISLSQAMPQLLTQPWNEEEEKEEVTEATDFSQVFKPMGDLMGFSAPPPKKDDDKFFDDEAYEDVSLWRVTLGYGIPTLLSIALATLVFCRRDL